MEGLNFTCIWNFKLEGKTSTVYCVGLHVTRFASSERATDHFVALHTLYHGTRKNFKEILSASASFTAFMKINTCKASQMNNGAAVAFVHEVFE